MRFIPKKQMQLDGFEENSFTAWSGRISLVIYFRSNNFQPVYLKGEGPGLDIIPTTWQRVRLVLEQNKDWIDGVVLKGGEPTDNPNIVELCRKIKLFGSPIKLYTNGTHPDVVENLIKMKLIDFICINVYAPLEFTKYQRVTGLRDKMKFLAIRRTVTNILTSDFPHEIRTIVASPFHTTKLIREIASSIRIAQKYVIESANNEYRLSNRELNSLAFAAKETIKNTEIQRSTTVG